MICLPFAVVVATTPPPPPPPTTTAEPFKVVGATVVVVLLLPMGCGDPFFLWKLSMSEDAGLSTPLGELSEKSVICGKRGKREEV